MCRLIEDISASLHPQLQALFDCCGADARFDLLMRIPEPLTSYMEE